MMDPQNVFDTISALSVGDIAAWAVAIAAIIGLLIFAIQKLYKAFKVYNDIRAKYDEQEKKMADHDEKLDAIMNALKAIQDSLSEQKDVNLKQIRHTIVHTCDDALASGCISAGKLRSLEEMYEEYLDVFNGNGYVKTLVKKVRLLPVVGQLDE